MRRSVLVAACGASSPEMHEMFDGASRVPAVPEVVYLMQYERMGSFKVVGASARDEIHGRALAGDEWRLLVTLPAGASPERVPPRLWDLMSVILQSHEEAVRFHGRGELARPLVRLATPVRDVAFWSEDAVQGELRQLLKAFWGLRFEIEPVPHGDSARIALRSPYAEGLADPPARALVFAPDMDSIAGLAGSAPGQDGDVVVVVEMAEESGPWLSCQRLVEHLFDIGGARVSAGLLSRGDGGASLAPDSLGLLRVTLGVAVAVAAGAREVVFYENGIENLQYPVTAAFLARRHDRTVHPGVVVSLGHLLARITENGPQMTNPLVSRTPAEVMGSLAAGREGALWAKIRWLQSSDDLALTSDELRIDRCVAALGALPADSSPGDSYARLLCRTLTAPMNENLADAYIHAIRELPELPAEELVKRLVSVPGHTSEGDARIAVELLRRHARATRGVLADAVRRHADQLIDGSLPPSCLIVRAAASRSTEAERARTRQPTFRRRADRWELWFGDGDWVYLSPLKGLDYLHLLIQHPGRIYSSSELTSLAAGQARITGGSGDVLADRKALHAYRTRISDLRSEIDTANDNNDLGVMARAQGELEALEAELERCVGLGGRQRTQSDSERARRAVSNAIHRAINRIRPVHRRLAEHLEGAVHIGLHLYYSPTQGVSWLT